MVKIKTLIVPKSGAYPLTMNIPKLWTGDLKLKPGDKIDVYRDEQDRLILVADHHEKDSS